MLLVLIALLVIFLAPLFVKLDLVLRPNLLDSRLNLLNSTVLKHAEKASRILLDFAL